MDIPTKLTLYHKLSSVLEVCKAATRMSCIDPSNAPIFIQQGKSDHAIPYFQSILLTVHMAAANGEE